MSMTVAAPAIYPSPAYPAEGPANPADQLQPLSIIDVSECFAALIRGYTLLEQSALTLAADLPNLPAEIILQRCQALRNDQQLLATHDSQVIDILNLAWEDLAAGGYISQYRSAFSATFLAIEAVHQQLLALRQSPSLLEAAAPVAYDRVPAGPA